MSDRLRRLTRFQFPTPNLPHSGKGFHLEVGRWKLGVDPDSFRHLRARLRLRPSRLRLARWHCLMFRRLTSENVTQVHEFPAVKTASSPWCKSRAAPRRAM